MSNVANVPGGDTQTAVEFIEGGTLTTVPGFRAAGVACGIKKNGALDLALLASSKPCVGAAVFTTNKIQSPSVMYDRELLRTHGDRIEGLVINSGCANAITGEQGLLDAREMSRLGALAVGNPDAAVAVMSTGVIGQHLPMERVADGTRQAAAALQTDASGGHAAARAIMTTDTRPKEAAAHVVIGGTVVT